MTIAEYAKKRKISRQTLYTKIRQAGIKVSREADGKLSAETVAQLDTLFDTQGAGDKPSDVQGDVKHDSQVDTHDAALIAENAILKARVASLEETLAFTRADLQKAQEALETAQRIADQAQQLQARAMMPLWRRIVLNLTEGRKKIKDD